MIVFRQHMSQIARLGRSRIAFAIQSGLGIGAALMGVTQQPLAATPAAPLRRLRFGLKAAPVRPRFQHRPIHRKMFVAQQP